MLSIKANLAEDMNLEYDVCQLVTPISPVRGEDGISVTWTQHISDGCMEFNLLNWEL